MTMRHATKTMQVQAYLGNTAGSIPVYYNEVNVATMQVTGVLGFPSTYKVIVTIYYSLLSAQ